MGVGVGKQSAHCAWSRAPRDSTETPSWKTPGPGARCLHCSGSGHWSGITLPQAEGSPVKTQPYTLKSSGCLQQHCLSWRRAVLWGS